MNEYDTPCGHRKIEVEFYSYIISNDSGTYNINEYVIRKDLNIVYKNILFDDSSIPFHATLEKELSNGIKNIEIINCVFEKDVFINKEFNNLSIKKCCFEGKFYINNQYNNPDEVIKIDTLIIEDTKFHANFKLHNSKIKNFILKDTDFEKNADFFRTKFLTTEDIVFHTINFRALAFFGNTVFNEHLLFKYVTFQGYSHFRQAEFKKGLNLEYSNIEKEMNFFGIEGLEQNPSVENTTQETYRIVKYQLQKVGNIIDSNKYHALELENEFFSMNIFKYISLFVNKEDFNANYLLFVLNKVILGYLYYQFVTAIRKDTRK